MAYAIGNVLDVLPTLDADRFQCVVTSPPYWGLRSYLGADDPQKDAEIGAEESLADYIDRMVAVFAEVRRVLRDDGTLWLNLGDCYAGARGGPQGKSGQMADRSIAKQRYREATDERRRAARPASRMADGLKRKDLIGVPWRVAFALQDDGWWLRQDNVWSKPNPLPESVDDRTTRAHEYVFHLTKSEHYFYDKDAIAEPAVWRGQGRHQRAPVPSSVPGAPPHVGLRKDGDPPEDRNCRSVWTVATVPFTGAHFAVMPPDLAQRCILAGSRLGDEVLDPFLGSGTVGMVAESLGRRWFGVELNAEYEPLIKQRTAQQGLFGRVG